MLQLITLDDLRCFVRAPIIRQSSEERTTAAAAATTTANDWPGACEYSVAKIRVRPATFCCAWFVWFYLKILGEFFYFTLFVFQFLSHSSR